MTSGEVARGPHTTFVLTLINAAMVAADEKLGRDTVALDFRGLVDSFDALVIVSGRNDRHVRAIVEEVERLVDVVIGVRPDRVEGWQSAEWIALDYVDVIVHVFDEAAREYYDLEHLWSAAPAQRAARIR